MPVEERLHYVAPEAQHPEVRGPASKRRGYRLRRPQQLDLPFPTQLDLPFDQAFEDANRKKLQQNV